LRASEDTVRALRKELEVNAARGGGGTNNLLTAALISSSSSSKQGDRPTLQQRQEALRAKQQEAKREVAAEAQRKKATSGSGNGGGDSDLPEYLKHLSKPQKKKYTDLVASERDLTIALEDSKAKVKELEERCELADEDAAEMRALLTASEASLEEAEQSRGQLEEYLSTLQDASEKYDSSVKSMAVKEDRLLWLESEVRKQRDELLSVAAVRGDAQDLKRWLDEERIAHDKQARNLHNLVGKLQKEVESYSSKDSANAAAKKEEEALQAQRMEAHKKRERELLEGRKKQHVLITDAVRELVVDLGNSVALACESATLTTTYSIQQVPNGSLDGKGVSAERKEQTPENTSYALRVVTDMSSSKKKPRRAGWLCGKSSNPKRYPQQPQASVVLRDKPQDTNNRAAEALPTSEPLKPPRKPSEAAL